MKMVLIRTAQADTVVDWLEGNVSPMLERPKDPKFIPFAIGEDWHVFTYSGLVEVWLPEDASSLLALRFVE